MSALRLYTPTGEMVRDDENGDWVKLGSFEAVEAAAKDLRDEVARLRGALQKIVDGLDPYGADHVLRKQYLADDEWWSLKRGDHGFALWIAWMALKQAALTPQAGKGGGA